MSRNTFLNHIFFFALFFFSFPALYAQQGAVSTIPEPILAPPPKPLTPKEILEERLINMTSDPVLKSANWGFVLYDPAKNKIISSYREDVPLVPASTTKLLTTESLLAKLGAKYTFYTQMEYSGIISDQGVLEGDLYLIGSGDPSLGTGKAGASGYASVIEQFVSAIRDLGIKKINGKIYTENAIFKENKLAELPMETVWVSHNNYFLPAGSSVGVNPKWEKTMVKSSKLSQNKSDYFYVSPTTDNMVTAEEYNPIAMTAKLPDAPAYLAKMLKTNLSKKGISVTGNIENLAANPNPVPTKLIFKYRSPDLGDIINYTNHKSDNALAEAMMRLCGFYYRGNYGIESGTQAVFQHLKSNGFDTSALHYVDGSGLSRAHKVTPISQAKYLGKLMKENYYPTFFESLPTAGQSGTLTNMFKSSPANGRVFAKTGTLNGVKTLAGYIKSQSGKTYTFSLLINGYKGSVSQVKSKMEKILEPIIDLP